MKKYRIVCISVGMMAAQDCMLRGDEQRGLEALENMRKEGADVSIARDEKLPQKPMIEVSIQSEATNTDLRELRAFKDLRSLNITTCRIADGAFEGLRADEIEIGELRRIYRHGTRRCRAIETTRTPNIGRKPRAFDRRSVNKSGGLEAIAAVTAGAKGYYEQKLGIAGGAQVAPWSPALRQNDRRNGTAAVSRTDEPGSTDGGITHLAGLEKLEALDLSFTRITDAGLKEIVALKQLRSLSLSGTRVSDAGLKELAELKQLLFLNVSGTKVTKQGIAALKRHVPACKVFQVEEEQGVF